MSCSDSLSRVILSIVILLLLFDHFNIRHIFRDHRNTAKVTATHRLATLKSDIHSEVIPLISRTNFWGAWENLDCPDRVCFNPTLLGLPFRDSNNDGHFVVIARDPDNTTFHPSGDYGHFTGTRSICGSLLELAPSKNTTRYRWSPAERFSGRCHNTQTLEDVVHMDERFARDIPESQKDCFLTTGPEDPRIFYSHLGEPLLLYNSIGAAHSTQCRHFYLVDVRSVYPVLDGILDNSVNPAPIRYSHSVPVLYNNQTGLQKNWMPFSDATGNVYVHTDLIPQAIYKLSLPSGPARHPNFHSPASDLVTLEPVVKSDVYQNCILLALGLPNYELDNSLGNQPLVIHQATPFLDVVLCFYNEVLSGVCDPEDPDNRVYMGLFHVLHRGGGHRIYERRIITLKSTPPFEYVSISKPLMYRMIPF